MSPWRWRGSVLFLSALASLVWGDYYIDDTNTTLTYSSGPKAAWAPYAVGAETLELLLPNATYQVIDAFVCYNHTYRYAACFDTDICLLTVPFTGSGITVYVYQAGPVGINASIAIDGAHNQTNVLAAPPAPAYQIANVTMFDVQQLPSGPHTLSLLINDLSGSYSGMMFDYAYVNESLVTGSQPTTTTTTSITGTSSPSPTSSPSKLHGDIGAIIGGVIGLLGVVIISVLILYWIRRQRGRAPEMIGLHSDASVLPPLYSPTAYDPSSGPYDPYVESSNPMRHLNPSRGAESPAPMPLIPNRLGSQDVRHSPSSRNNNQDILTPFTATSSGSNSSGTRNRKNRLVLSNDTPSAPLPQQTSHSPSDSRQDTSPLLTDEQADFINSLHQNNVPAAAIARVVERMLADRHAGIREWERETRLARTNTMTTAPPSYDLIAERDS